MAQDNQYVEADFNVVKKIFHNRTIVANYIEMKDLWIDSLDHGAMTNQFLEGIVLGKIWAPNKNKSEGWKIVRKCSRMEVWDRLKALSLPNGMTHGYKITNFPSREYMLRQLKQLSPNDDLFL